MNPRMHVGQPEASNKLTRREFDIVWFIHKGFTNREVGLRVGISEFVVKNYLRHIYDKLGFSNRLELALWLENKLFLIGCGEGQR